MKVAILLFLSLSLLEPMESHGLHAWTFMNLKNNFGQRQQPKDSKDGFAVGTTLVPNPIRGLYKYRVVRENEQKSHEDMNCKDIGAWTIRWFVYGCKIFATRQSNRIWIS